MSLNAIKCYFNCLYVSSSYHVLSHPMLCPFSCPHLLLFSSPLLSTTPCSDIGVAMFPRKSTIEISSPNSKIVFQQSGNSFLHSYITFSPWLPATILHNHLTQFLHLFPSPFCQHVKQDRIFDPFPSCRHDLQEVPASNITLK